MIILISTQIIVLLIRKPINRLLPIFSPDLTLNSQIWLFYAEKWVFLKKLSILLNLFAPGELGVERPSGDLHSNYY